MTQTARIRTAQLLAMLVAVAMLWANTPGLAAAAQGPAVADPRFDITGNQLITSADVAALSNVWTVAQEQATCALDSFGSADLNGDGCIDIADMQLTAAQMGNATNLNAPQLRVSAAAAAAAPEITLTVNALSSEDDATLGDGMCATALGACTFRAALQEANSRPGPELINFAIPSATPTATCTTVTIRPNKNVVAYYTLEDQTGPITINGYSQCDAKANSAATAGNAVLRVQIDGQWTSGTKSYVASHGVDGLTIMSPNNVVRGLALLRWDHQIMIMNKEAKFNHIEGNVIGSTADQSFSRGTGATDHDEGIRMRLAANYNVIGCGTFPGGVYTPCTDPTLAYAARNVVAGNGNDGIHLQGSGNTGNIYSPTGNHIVGNIIGLKQDGLKAQANHGDANDFEQGAFGNWLGGETALERNIISGNGSEGIEISHDIHTQYNRVVGNYFGLDITGTKAVRNHGNGISFEDTVDSNYAYKNVVSGNYGNGIRFYVGATNNQVYDNLIGFSADGKIALPNGPTENSYGQNGVYVMGGSQHNKIRNNIIANHNGYGVKVDGESDDDHFAAGPTWYNTISQNTIYDNGQDGIFLDDATNKATGITYIGNQNLAKPSISKAGTEYVVGKTCANCTVEVFIADNTATHDGVAVTFNSGSGKTFIGSAVAGADGQFNVPVTGVKVDELVTASTTDPEGNTSKFATNKIVQVGPVATLVPGPTLTPTPGMEATATAIAATETAAANVAATQIAQATAQASATAAAEDLATAVAQTAESAPTTAAQTATAIIGNAQTATAQVNTVQTATAGVATSVVQTALAATASANPAPDLSPTATKTPGTYKVLLPMITK